MAVWSQRRGKLPATGLKWDAFQVCAIKVNAKYALVNVDHQRLAILGPTRNSVGISGCNIPGKSQFFTWKFWDEEVAVEYTSHCYPYDDSYE